MIIRTIFLLTIDFLSQILSTLRRTFAYSIDELPSNSSMVYDSFFPYDIVLPVKSISNPDYRAVDSSHYNIGVVIGFTKFGPNRPGKIKVAHFNVAEVGVPHIAYYNKEELALLVAPLDTIKYLDDVLKMEVGNESKDSEDEGGSGSGGDFTVH